MHLPATYVCQVYARDLRGVYYGWLKHGEGLCRWAAVGCMHTNSSTTSSISGGAERFACDLGEPAFVPFADGESTSLSEMLDVASSTVACRSPSLPLLLLLLLPLPLPAVYSTAAPLPRMTASVLPRTAAGRREPAPSHGSGACVVVTSQFGWSTPAKQARCEQDMRVRFNHLLAAAGASIHRRSN